MRHHARSVASVIVLLSTAGCLVLTSCAGASSGPPQATASAPLAPTEADRVWAETGLGADQRPAVDRVRLVSVFERAEVIAGCLRGFGYPQAVVHEGEIQVEGVADDDQGSLALSTYICDAQYPTDPVFDVPLTEDEIRALYRYRAGDQRACLQGLGHLIARPPTEQAFLDGYAEHGGWNPLNMVPQGSFEAALAACPALPPSLAE